MSGNIEIAEPLDIDGTITDVDTFEESPARVTNVINRKKPWGMRIDWEISGVAYNLGLLMPCEWQLQMHLEAIGATPSDVDYPGGGPVTLLYSAGTDNGNARTFSQDISVPANEAAIPAGLYKPVVTLQLFDAGGNPQNVLGFAESTLIRVHDGP